MDRRNFKIGIGSALLLLQGCVGLVWAEDMLIGENQADGLLVITDQRCKKQGGLVTKTTGPFGKVVLWGCSIPVEGNLWNVRWNNGHEAYLDIGSFVTTEAFRVRYANSAGPTWYPYDGKGRPAHLSGAFSTK
jgi:hypothetical protein